MVEYAFLLVCVTALAGAGVKGIHLKTAAKATMAASTLSGEAGSVGGAGGGPAGGIGGGTPAPVMGNGPGGSTGGAGGTTGPATHKPTNGKKPTKIEKKGEQEEDDQPS